MGIVDRKLGLLDALTRLRRAGRLHPHDDDIRAVRTFLEAELGPTVSRRLAARYLGVTHPALARWIESGDLPVVYTQSAKTEVPVDALLQLHEHSELARLGRRRHVLEPKVLADRAAASALDTGRLLSQAEFEEGGHGTPERRALAYHRAVAERLRRADVTEARQVLARWRSQGRVAEEYAARWESLLAQPLPVIRRAIGADTQDARDLRQNSPFAGMLSEAERRKILSEVR
ncbi:hypothetical protein [Patulibacter americanus]|uniref:hypothetical protein n=1 Tax=Patulibacter americanus TaxID=588672 RepID=UPI0003B4D127|nr:hypothetical protein [Patulibacter americanus]